MDRKLQAFLLSLLGSSDVALCCLSHCEEFEKVSHRPLFLGYFVDGALKLDCQTLFFTHGNFVDVERNAQDERPHIVNL